MSDVTEESGLSLVSVPATIRQRRAALTVIIAIFAAFAALAPFALTPLPRLDGYIPAVQSIISVTDLLTAVLLFAQYASAPSRALLVLGGGYLFSALIAAAQTLTFPGAFSPTGVFGSGLQTAAWLYVVWHGAFPLAVGGYAVLKRRTFAHHEARPASAAVAIGWAVMIAGALAVALTWATIAWHDRLPVLSVSETTFSATTSYVTTVILLLTVLAFALLASRRSSVLDWWLTVAVCGAIAESALITFVAASRYTLAFYAGRAFAIVVSSGVLAALLWEMMRLQARLAFAIRALQRERTAKLLNLQVMLAVVAHEVKQPLMAIGLYADAARHFLKPSSANLDGARESIDDIKQASRRVGEVLDNIRALAKNPERERKPIDPNELVVASLEHLGAEIDKHDITVSLALTPELQPIMGHRGQLQEVLLNIMQNAIEAMSTVTNRPRVLRIDTEARDAGRVLISIEDSGCGIEPQRLAALFDSHISTKAHGIGLGLAICRMIIDRHGGDIKASSQVGRGSRFEVTLPVDRTAAVDAESVGRPQRAILKSTPYMRGST
ncbi:MAG TPA: MASE4 domain-containing protein [Gammaproteobacteria bacterium]